MWAFAACRCLPACLQSRCGSPLIIVVGGCLSCRGQPRTNRREHSVFSDGWLCGFVFFSERRRRWRSRRKLLLPLRFFLLLVFLDEIFGKTPAACHAAAPIPTTIIAQISHPFLSILFHHHHLLLFLSPPCRSIPGLQPASYCFRSTSLSPHFT